MKTSVRVGHLFLGKVNEGVAATAYRSRKMDKNRDLEVGDLALVISPDQPRGHWPLGRIIEVFPGKDAHVRVAKVQVGNSAMVRPITKLAQVEIESKTKVL